MRAFIIIIFSIITSLLKAMYFLNTLSVVYFKSKLAYASSQLSINDRIIYVQYLKSIARKKISHEFL